MDVGDYETNTVVVANIASVAFRVYQLVDSTSPSSPTSPTSAGFSSPLTDIERALRNDGHFVFTDSLRHAIWHFQLRRKDGSALGAHTLPELGATVGIGPHTLAAVEEGSLDPASLQTGQPVLSGAFGGRSAQNSNAQSAPQGVSSPASALSFFDAAARSPFAPPSMSQSQVPVSAAISPAGGGMDLDLFQPSPPSQQNQQSQERQESFASQSSRESRESQESQANRARQPRDASESSEGPTFAEVSAKVVYNFFISAVLAVLAPTYCAKSRAIALNARTFLLPPLDPLWDGRESSRTDSRSLVATLRVTLTTAGTLLIGVSHRVLRGLGCSAWACYAGLPPPGASVLTAPWGVFAIVRGVYPPSVLLDDDGDSADEFEAEPRPKRRKKKRRGQSKGKPTGKKRKEQRRRQQQRQERRQRYAAPHVPPEWKSFATDLLKLHGISPAVLRKAAWLRLELPLDEEIPDGEPVEILWPSSLCYWSLESPTRNDAPFERLNPLADVRAAYLAQVHAEEVASGLAMDESKEDQAEDAAMEDIQPVPGLDKGALQTSDGPSPLGTRNPVWLPSGVPGSSVYPTPPDGLPNPVGATPTFDGTVASPGNAASAAAPAGLDPSMTETALADDTFGAFWGGEEPKREEIEHPFLDEPDNMFGDIGADMFGDDVTDADFSFFDEKPASGPVALPPPTAPPLADNTAEETMEVDSGVQGPDIELPTGRDEHSTPDSATATSSPAPPSALASLPSFPGPPQPQLRLPPPPETIGEESTDPNPEPGPDDKSGQTQAPPDFVKPELRHAPSRIADAARGTLAKGGSIKRPPSPFNALTVFKRVKAMAAADQAHRSNLFEGLRFTEFMIQNTKKYEQSGKFGFSWPHPEADLQSDIASATSPTAFRRPVAGKRTPLSDASPEFAALVTSITRNLQSSSLQPRRRLPAGGGDGSSDVSKVLPSSDWTDGSSSETDDDGSDDDDTTDSGINDYIYVTDDDEGFAVEKRAVDDDEEESEDEDSNSEDDNDNNNEGAADDDEDEDDDDEPLSVHREDRRRKARAMASAVPLQEAAAELARACSEGVWDFPIARFFADPMPPATELAYADDDIVDVAQILTQQVTRATIRRSSGGGLFLDDDDEGDGQTLSQVRLHMRHSVTTLEASLPACLAADAVRCALKPYLEVTADVPAAAAASTNALQPHQPVRPPPIAAAAAAAAAAGPTGGPSLFPVPPPHVELRRNETMLSLLPTAVEFWEVLGLEPLHGPKDVRAVCLHPAYEGLADDVHGFLARMQIAYESLRLGSHEPLAAMGGMVSFAPGSAAGAAASAVPSGRGGRGGGAFPGGEEVQMLAQALAAEDTRGKSVVVYFVYCADVSSAVVEACLAFRRLAQLYARAAAAGRSGTGPHNELVLQLVPTAFLSSPTSLVRVPSTVELLRLSLEVYDRCAAPRGPRPAPSFLLEQPTPRMVDLRLSPTPSMDVQRENSCIHVAYAASADGRWVTAAWSDGSGWRQFSAAYWVARKGEPAAHGFAAVAQEIWDNTCALVANLKVHWRAIVAKCGGNGAGAGAFDNEEIEAWTELARSETRASISLTLVRVDSQPSLELLPPLTTALTAPLPTILPLLSAATPVPTPAAGSVVFSPDQSSGGGVGGGNPVTPAASFGAYPTTPATPATPGAGGGGGGGGPSQSPAGPTGTAAASSTNASAGADAAAAAKLAAAGADPSAVADVDGNVVLVDITDSTWGAVAAHRRNTAATWVDQRPALVSGFLVKRGGTGADDTPVVLEIDVVRVGWATPSTATTAAGTPTTPTTPTVGTPAAAAARGHDALLREILVAYRALGTLARARGILDGERDVRPWHVAAAERAAKVLCQRM